MPCVLLLQDAARGDAKHTRLHPEHVHTCRQCGRIRPADFSNSDDCAPSPLPHPLPLTSPSPAPTPACPCSPFVTMSLFTSDKAFYVKEAGQDMYSPAAYYLAKITVSS
jgi:hypothetical protein